MSTFFNDFKENTGRPIRGPWEAKRNHYGEWYVREADNLTVCNVGTDGKKFAALISASPDFYEAALALEKAELAHANCDECNGEGVPELCEKCFPLFDDARLKRRAAIAKAEGKVVE